MILHLLLEIFCHTGDLSETEEERNEAVARKDIEHYDFSCVPYSAIWDQVKEQVDKIHQELKVLTLCKKFNAIC